jgi:hypothetical protein
MNPITMAIAKVNHLGVLSKIVGAQYQQLRLWEKRGRLPRSEFTGETRYARGLSRACGREVSPREILAWSRKGWEAATRKKKKKKKK